jgi:heme exporter protein CcmD
VKWQIGGRNNWTVNMFEQLFNMQGYGGYIWGSVLLTLGILAGNAWYAVYQLRKAQQQSSKSA